MVRAAARGLLDYPGADIRDRRWWTRLSWTIDQLEYDDLDVVSQLRAMQHMSLITYNMETKVFEQHWKPINDFIGAIHARRFPWASAVDNQLGNELRDLWITHYGDPDDPAVKKQISEVVQYLESQQRQARTAPVVAQPTQSRQRLTRLSRR